MKITYYISEPDCDGLSSVWAGRWDVTAPIEKASAAWPCRGIVNSRGDLQAFLGPEAARQGLQECRPLTAGQTITLETP